MGDILITDKDGVLLSIDKNHEYLRSRIRMEHKIADIAEKLVTPVEKPVEKDEYTLEDKMSDEYGNDPQSFMDDEEIANEEAEEIEREKQDYARDSI